MTKLDLKNLPKEPGVYIFKNEKDEVIYVGKSKNIKKRVLSYFKEDKNPKTKVLVKNIKNIETILTDNEYEALLLESNLIKKYYPKYNVLLKDTSKEIYVVITAEDFPRVLTIRKNRSGLIKQKGKIYGPFLSSDIKKVVSILRKMFKIRTCKIMPKKVCLQYYLGNCDGPCEGKISQSQYNENVNKLNELLSDEINLLNYLNFLEQEMKKYSQNLEFEKALALRNSINSLRYLLNKQKIEKSDPKNEDYVALQEDNNKVYVQVWKMRNGVICGREKFRFEIMDEDPAEEFIKRYYNASNTPTKIYLNKIPKEKAILEKYLKEQALHHVEIKNGLKRKESRDLLELILKNIYLEKQKGGIDLSIIQLQKELDLLKPPLIIEAFDISNLKNQGIVAGMVRFENASPNKNEYRKFKIRTTQTQNDFQSIREVVFRRYNRLKTENKRYPDMVLIDGGIGQLSAAKDALEELDIQIPLFSFDKEKELIHFIKNNRFESKKLTQESTMFIKNIINNVHRFALSYNKKIRSKIN